MKQLLYIIRRNSGQGGAERVAERLAASFSDQFEVYRLWAGNQFNGQKIPGFSGILWWRHWRYAHYINRLAIYKQNSVVYSLEKGPTCDIYRAGDGVHRINMLGKYGSSKAWMVNPVHWLMPKLERNSFESARYIIANSELVRSQVVSAYPHVEHKMVTIYNGFDEQTFKLSQIDKLTLRKQLELPLDADKILLLSGSGFERKGLHHAIGIVKNLHERGCKAYLVVVGKGDSSYVKKLINQTGLIEFILFKGLINNVAQYYQASDMLVLLTRHDPFANACLEAWACGCPVITTRDNGASEVMKPFSGLLVDDILHKKAIGQCAEYIMQQAFEAPKIAASVEFLTADKEKAAHLEIVNKVFTEKSAEGHKARF
ncbi:UDP-glucose:(heptosyl)LPS alpha-1,3-glucosyltransferase [Bathymodiolus platifrons methanotrophic gill symbiont]|uniref:glycosyltransferase n=1 Tax=Bathymodiolus platifrons methanotrophic gill symbiont TaxID=113268 RepID=UPI000B40E857|nr:glycosyltransferase [Bathymodiolus platifrons methanotrophic gill symbiont]GAW87029.1 UDP-glucose:(heptosyl)LPS alpha-1,3-glucosyltransferase [Bathymodiolus platifrons methanotrophic gill symbiont]